jgi:hypothetical protein
MRAIGGRRGHWCLGCGNGVLVCQGGHVWQGRLCLGFRATAWVAQSNTFHPVCYDESVFPRFLHFESRPGSDGLPRYAVYDGNRNGDAVSGFTQPAAMLNRDEACQLLAWQGVPQPEIGRLLRQLDAEGSASVPLNARIGPRIVRAWFDTVINPLIDSVESEMALAAKENWTWRFRPPSLELIRPVSRYLERSAVASLEQICDLEPEIKAMTQSHDDGVATVFGSAAVLHDALTSSQEFTGLCDRFWDPEALTTTGLVDIKDIIGAYPLEDRYNLIAQYVVNNVQELPDYYTTSKFWNRNRAALIGSLAQPAIHPHHKSLLLAGERLEGSTQSLLRRLKELRLKLSLEHDVPYVLGSLASAFS